MLLYNMETLEINPETKKKLEQIAKEIKEKKKVKEAKPENNFDDYNWFNEQGL
jgi:hypothetical protein